jgi:hypothetical protein
MKLFTPSSSLLFFILLLSTRILGQEIMVPSTFKLKKGTPVTLSSPDVIEASMRNLIEKDVNAFNSAREQKDVGNESRLSVHVGVVRLRGYVQSTVKPEEIDQVSTAYKLFKMESSFVMPTQKQYLEQRHQESRNQNFAEMKEKLALTEKTILKELDDFQIAEGKTERVSHLIIILEYLDPSDNKLHSIERHSTTFNGIRLDLLEDKLKQRVTDQKLENLPGDNTSTRGVIAYGHVLKILKALNELYDGPITDYTFCGKTTTDWTKTQGITAQEQQKVTSTIADRLNDPNFEHDYYSYPSQAGKSKNLIPDPGLFRALTNTSLFEQEILPDLLNGLNSPGKCDYEVWVAFQYVENFIPEDKRGKLAEEVYQKSTRLSKSGKKAILFVVPYIWCTGGGDGINSTIYMPGVYGPDPEMNSSINRALLRWSRDFEKGFREAISFIPHDVEAHYVEIQLQGDYIYSGLKIHERITGLLAQDVAQVYITQDTRFELIMAAYKAAEKECDDKIENDKSPILRNAHTPAKDRHKKWECMAPNLSKILSNARIMGKVGIQVIDLSITKNLIRSKITETMVRTLIEAYISQRLPVGANIKQGTGEIEFGKTGIDKAYFYNKKSPLPETTWFGEAMYTIAEIGNYIPIPVVNNIMAGFGTLYAYYEGNDNKIAYFAVTVTTPFLIGPILKGAFVGARFLVRKSSGAFRWIESKAPSLFRPAGQTSQYLESLLLPNTYASVVKQNDNAFINAVEEACGLDARTMAAVDAATLNGFLRTGLEKNGRELLAYIQRTKGTIGEELPTVISLGSDLIGEAGRRLPINTGALDVLYHLNPAGEIVMTLRNGITQTLSIDKFIEQLGAIKAFQEATIVRLGSCTEGGYLNEVARRLSEKYPDKKFLALVSKEPALTGVARNGDIVVLQGGKVTEDVFVKGKRVPGKAIRPATPTELTDNIIALGKDKYEPIKIVIPNKGLKEFPLIEMEDGLKITATSLKENLVVIEGTLAKSMKGQPVIQSQIPGVSSLSITMDDLMSKIQSTISSDNPLVFMFKDPGNAAQQLDFLRSITSRLQQGKIKPTYVKINKEPLLLSTFPGGAKSTLLPIKSRSIETYYFRHPDGFVVDSYRGIDQSPFVEVFIEETSDLLGSAGINNGIINLAIKVKIPNNPGISGRQVFRALYKDMETHRGPIKGILGQWTMSPEWRENLDSFNEEILKIIKRETGNRNLSLSDPLLIEIKKRAPYEAAGETFTGKMAKEQGFCCVTSIDGGVRNDGTYNFANVTFSNVAGPYSKPLQSFTAEVGRAIETAQIGFLASHPVELKTFKETLQRKIIEASTKEGRDYAGMLNVHNGTENWVANAYRDMVEYGVKDFDFATFAAKMESISICETTPTLFDDLIFIPQGAYKKPDVMKSVKDRLYDPAYSNSLKQYLKPNKLTSMGLSDKAIERAWLLAKNQNSTVGEKIGLKRFDLRLEDALNRIKDTQKRNEMVAYFNNNIDQINQIYREMDLFGLDVVNLEIFREKLLIFDLFSGSKLRMFTFEEKVFIPLGGYSKSVQFYKDLLSDLKSLNKDGLKSITNDLSLIEKAISKGKTVKELLAELLAKKQNKLEPVLKRITNAQKRKEMADYFNQNINRLDQVCIEIDRFGSDVVNLETYRVKLSIFDVLKEHSVTMSKFEEDVFKPLGGYNKPVQVYEDLLADLKTLDGNGLDFIARDLPLIVEAIEDEVPLQLLLGDLITK